MSFSVTAREAAREVKAFAKLIQTTRSKEIFEKAKARQMEKPEGITNWRSQDHKDWLDVKNLDGDDVSIVDFTDDLKKDESFDLPVLSAALEKFRETELLFDEESKTLQIKVSFDDF